MQISGISSISPISSIVPAQQANGPNSRISAQTSSSNETASTSASSAASKTASSSKSAPASSGSKSSGGGSGGGAASSSAASLIAATYSTTVNGKTYSGSVQESNGEYTASVPGLASASGGSIDAAEISLGSIIDAIA